MNNVFGITNAARCAIHFASHRWRRTTHAEAEITVDQFWEVQEIDSDEVESHADDAGNRVLLCTKVGPEAIGKFELSVEDLDRRNIERN